MTMRNLLLAGLSAAALGACSQPPASNGATANAAGKQGGDHSGMAMSGPFARSEASMHAKMASAVGVDASDTWVRKMIEHHQGAVDMSREVLAMNPAPEVRRMAEMTIDQQGKEIEALRRLVLEGTPDPAAGQLYAAADSAMMQGMTAATGATPSEAWTRKMIEHHRGALSMSDVVLARDPTAEVRRLAEQTKVDQGREIAELERMLQAGGKQG